MAQKSGFVGAAKEANIDVMVLSFARRGYNDSQSFFNCSKNGEFSWVT